MPTTKDWIRVRREVWLLPASESPVRAPKALSSPRVCLAGLFFALSFAMGLMAAPQPSRQPMVLRGNLGLLPGNVPTLQTEDKTYRLAGQSPYILHTLEDKRLLHQELQLVGTVGPGGDFVVQRLYALRNGKLYKIQYYCEVCNITYVQPGHCACCGRETKLQEVPVAGGE
jgi:hypothetical protein